MRIAGSAGGWTNGIGDGRWARKMKRRRLESVAEWETADSVAPPNDVTESDGDARRTQGRERRSYRYEAGWAEWPSRRRRWARWVRNEDEDDGDEPAGASRGEGRGGGDVEWKIERRRRRRHLSLER